MINERRIIMKCWFCGSLLIWENDNSFEDFNMYGEGIVTTLTCPCCHAMWQGYLDLNEEE